MLDPKNIKISSRSPTSKDPLSKQQTSTNGGAFRIRRNTVELTTDEVENKNLITRDTINETRHHVKFEAKFELLDLNIKRRQSPPPQLTVQVPHAKYMDHNQNSLQRVISKEDLKPKINVKVDNNFRIKYVHQNNQMSRNKVIDRISHTTINTSLKGYAKEGTLTT